MKIKDWKLETGFPNGFDRIFKYEFETIIISNHVEFAVVFLIKSMIWWELMKINNSSQLIIVMMNEISFTIFDNKFMDFDLRNET
jgi:hypothetical protein